MNLYGKPQLVFGTRDIERIVNTPPGAKAEVISEPDEFLRAEVTFPNGTTEYWFLSEIGNGEFKLELLQSRVEKYSGFFAVSRICLVPFAALYWVLWPILFPLRKAYNFLVDDWQEYLKELEQTHRYNHN